MMNPNQSRGIGALSRSRKGYVFSLFVFLIMAGAFILVITNMKSVSVLQDSNYERITMMKASNLAKNIAEVTNAVNCPTVLGTLDEFTSFTVTVDCYDSHIVKVTSQSGGYSYSARWV